MKNLRLRYTKAVAIIHAIDIDADTRVIVFGDPEMGGYEWGIERKGKVEEHSDVGYGNIPAALRDGLMTAWPPMDDGLTPNAAPSSIARHIDAEGLGACPMCRLSEKVKVYPGFFVKCNGCGLTTGKYHHPDFAATMWNSLLAARSAAARKRPTEDPAAVRVMKVRIEPSFIGPSLIIAEDEKDSLLDYFEDWRGKLYIEFATMTRAEIDALPEFDGF